MECIKMGKTIFNKENIQLNAAIGTKEEAIRLTGGILVKEGYVDSTILKKCLREND